MNTKLKNLAGRAVLAGLLFTAANAQAVDLRSWDQKINQASKRFVVLAAFNNEAVLDKETQLVWQRQPSTAIVDWAAAQRHCASLAIAGRAGWRLPSGTELTSLLDLSHTGDDKLPAGHPFTKAHFQAQFWASTLDPVSAQQAGVMNTLLGTYGTLFIGGDIPFAWCVRGPASSN